MLLAGVTSVTIGVAMSAPAAATTTLAHHPAAKQCTSTSKTGSRPSRYNRTPKGAGPWSVPLDPCNTEGTGASATPYFNCAYWTAEKRPDVWVNAVWKFGYSTKKPGAWRILVDAKKAGYPTDHKPQAGDIAAWGRNAPMGNAPGGTHYTASPGGHVAYVEKVLSKSKIVMSSMGTGANGGITTKLMFNKKHTTFIHSK